MKRGERTKTCICGKEFLPRTSLQKTCPNYSCYKLLQKSKKKVKTERIKKIVLDDKLRNRADKLLQEKYTQGKCESCDKNMAVCLHHYIYKSQSNFLRYYPGNLINICAECHTRHHKSGDSEIMSRVIAKRGIEWEQLLQRLRRTPCKLTIPYLEEQIKLLEV